jgi:hypothetical protein
MKATQRARLERFADEALAQHKSATAILGRDGTVLGWPFNYPTRRTVAHRLRHYTVRADGRLRYQPVARFR